MRALLPREGPDPNTDDGLHDRYIPPRRNWVRGNMISSLDGAMNVEGRTEGLSTAKDQQVLAMLRDHADVILVGSGTVIKEAYKAPAPNDRHRARRTAAGLAPYPRLAVISSNADFDGSEPWIADAKLPPVILTTEAGRRPIPGAQTIICGEHRVDLTVALAALTAAGLAAVLCEGGPHLLSQLVATGRLDELAVSYAPVLVGPGPGRILDGGPLGSPLPMRLHSVLEHDSMLLCLFRRH